MLRVGEPVVRVDGSRAVVVALHVVPGAADMWDLTVSNVHTFVVGAGAYVVHNCAMPGQTPESWGNPNTLAKHFGDHGADFGATSPDDYASRAAQFLQDAQAQGLPTKVDVNGVIRVYDPATNTFGAYNPDGTTRTFFKPTSPTYWNRQPGLAPLLF